jgi:hypothetical protein
MGARRMLHSSLDDRPSRLHRRERVGRVPGRNPRHARPYPRRERLRSQVRQGLQLAVSGTSAFGLLRGKADVTLGTRFGKE